MKGALLASLLLGCLPEVDEPPVPSWDSVVWEELEPLALGVSNNAVAAGTDDNDCRVYSFMGIRGGLGFDDVTADAQCLEPGGWRDLGEVPGGVGRVAANAVNLGEEVVLLGGYSIAANGAETSFDRVDAWLPWTETWVDRPPLPVAVDDAVVAPWRNRWIVVVSGWSQNDNIDTVQIYDSVSQSWRVTDPFPGTPVFGAAGTILGDDLLLVDGVARVGNSFELIEQAWVGHLGGDGTIDWEDLGEHPGPPRYRAAGGSTAERIVISGGGGGAYNVDGLAYASNEPVEPVPGAITWSPEGWGEWDTPFATMDHRALASSDELVLVGGMTEGPELSRAVWAGRPAD